MRAQLTTSTSGLLFGLAAYVMWGLFPIYWKQTAAVPAGEVLALRISGSLVFVVVLLAIRKRLRATIELLFEPKTRRALLLSTTLVSMNWGLFIWAVSNARVTQTSLGYYMNPLLNVALGTLVLGERLSRGQGIAVGLAALGVGYIAWASGGLPWVSLVLASTFAVYGLIRKRTSAGALEGLAVETGLATPVAVIYLLTLAPPGGHLATARGSVLWFLLGAGVATALPLLAFAGAARRLRYTTVGILQYIAPTLQLGCAVWLYGEPFGRDQLVAFCFIWAAVLVYLIDALHRRPSAASGARATR